tara:strand:- start:5374 stop:5838 length:465 start_codon:yes stop_codon:yes gene_type:complete
MKHIFGYIIAALIFLSTGFAHEYENEVVLVDHPWMKIFETKGAGYFVLKNKSKNSDINLISAKSLSIKKIEIHNIIIENDIMKMRPVEGGVSVTPETSFEFKPKSYHLMFFGIEGKYESGDMIDVELIFEKIKSIHIKFKVETVKSSHNHDHDH